MIRPLSLISMLKRHACFKPILFICLFVVIIVLLVNLRTRQPRTPSLRIAHGRKHANDIFAISNKNVGFLVDTEGCRIQNVNPFDKLVESYVWRPEPLRCQGYGPLLFEDGPYIRFNHTSLKLDFNHDFSYCEYHPIVRPYYGVDTKVYFTNEVFQFHDDIQVKAEFMRIYCYSKSSGVIYVNFHAVILPKPDIQKNKQEEFEKHKAKIETKDNLNVLMIGIDSLSRLNSIRQLAKTRQFLLKYRSGIELSGYNKVADNTFVNLVPMTCGKFVEELPWNETMANIPFDKHAFIWKEFSQAGYMTLFAEDAPEMATFNYMKAGFHAQPTDYYLRPFSLALERHRALWNQQHDCFGDRSESQIVLDWVRQFVLSVNQTQNPFFSLVFLTRLTHDYPNKAGLADKIHANFLHQLDQSGSLNNTVLVYFSDHGMRFGDVRSTYIGKLEERLPFMIISFPLWFYTKYSEISENLRLNAQRLTTPFDIYETLKDILYFNDDFLNTTSAENEQIQQSRGISLFRKIPPTRTCEMAGILSHWCACQIQEPFPTNNPLVIQLVNFIIKYINTKLPSKKCAELHVKSIVEASRLIPNEKVLRFQQSLHDVIGRKVFFGERTKAILDYQVMLVTAPGDGMFEATVRVSEIDDEFTIIGDISRVNRYNSDGKCMEIFSLQKYCYCV